MHERIVPHMYIEDRKPIILTQFFFAEICQQYQKILLAIKTLFYRSLWISVYIYFNGHKYAMFAVSHNTFMMKQFLIKTRKHIRCQPCNHVSTHYIAFLI